MKDNTLNKARKLFKRRQFAEVIRILEPQVFRFRESFQFFYLLGTSCLYTLDYGGADSYLRRALNLKPEDIDARLGIAAVALKRRNIQEAVRILLNVLEDAPKNNQAQKALNTIRRMPENGAIYEFIESKHFKRFFPKLPVYIPGKYIFLFLLLVIIGSSVPFGIRYIPELIESTDRHRSGPEITEQILAGEITNYSETFQFIFSDQELENKLQEIQRLFDQYHDNLVRREVNRILLSNANENIKDHVTGFIDHLNEPNFSTFGRNFSYETVESNPLLHDGCYIRWSGRLSNLTIGEDAIRFDFLVGYEDERLLEGVVPVYLEFATTLHEGLPYEILAQIELYGDSPSIRLRGVSLHRLSERSE
ncbi:MAG: tetratricopeptide repeat protein [Spirochaetia bacterium]